MVGAEAEIDLEHSVQTVPPVGGTRLQALEAGHFELAMKLCRRWAPLVEAHGLPIALFAVVVRVPAPETALSSGQVSLVQVRNRYEQVTASLEDARGFSEARGQATFEVPERAPGEVEIEMAIGKARLSVIAGSELDLWEALLESDDGAPAEVQADRLVPLGGGIERPLTQTQPPSRTRALAGSR